MTCFPYQSGTTRLFWLIPLVTAFSLLLLQGISIVISFSERSDTLVPQPGDYVAFVFLLGSLVLSVSLLKRSREVTQVLPASIIFSGGAALGIPLGSLLNTSLGLMLLFGGLGPILGFFSRQSSSLPPGSPLGPPTDLDIGLGILCTFLSLLLYALLAFLVTRKTNSSDGFAAVLLAVFTTILMASATAVLIDFKPLLTGSLAISSITYSLASCKSLVPVSMLLGISQVAHAVIGGLMGSSLASVGSARRRKACSSIPPSEQEWTTSIQ